HWDRVASRDAEKTYNLKSAADLQALSKNILWSEYLAGADLSDSLLEWNVVMMPSFFEGLDEVVTEDSLVNLKLWLSWNVVSSYAAYLSKEFVDERFRFYGQKLTGQPTNRPRWKRA
ncbi:MAG: M13 family metallopeptidase N-terminal domain-containing protein, partial [Aquiluna sp.]